MKILKVLLLVAIVASFCAVGAYADEAALAGTVATISSMTVTTNGEALSSASLGTTTLSGVKVIQLEVDNNDSDGYTITLSSANGGYLNRNNPIGSTPNATSEMLAYTIDLVKGTATNIGYGRASISTLQLDVSRQYNFNTVTGSPESAALEATVDQIFDVKLNASSKEELFRGTYSDTITVTMADN